jgi:hypothetical protein
MRPEDRERANRKDLPRDEEHLPRRDFVRAVGAVGAMGVVGSLGTSRLSPETLSAKAASGPPRASNPQQAGDFARPEALRPGAQSDSRFPVSFAEPVPQGLRLAMEYFTALDQRDIRGIADTLHFPFAINENIEPIVFRTADELGAQPAPTLNFTSRGLSRVGEGSYDLFEGIDCHPYCPVGAVMSVSFTRHNVRGYKLGDYDGLLSVTNNDGRWAIQMVSTIFHETGYEGIEYPFVAETEIQESQGYLAAFGYRDEATLNDLAIGRGSYGARLPVDTRTASVSFGYGPRDRTRNARNGTPMVGWVTTGVMSRLTVSTVRELPTDARTETNLDEFVDLAGETVGEYSYTRFPPRRPIVIHATHDKAHLLGGYARFTPEGELISETRSAGIRIYKGGVWGSGGGLGQVTHHDRANSVG